MAAMDDDDPTEAASPVCYLPEADDGYAGYLTPAEVTDLLRRWIGLAGSHPVAQVLTALLAERGGSGSRGEAADLTLLREEMRATLPKIRDDDLHRRLSQASKTL